jgi:hypothetical protein
MSTITIEVPDGLVVKPGSRVVLEHGDGGLRVASVTPSSTSLSPQEKKSRFDEFVREWAGAAMPLVDESFDQALAQRIGQKHVK